MPSAPAASPTLRDTEPTPLRARLVAVTLDLVAERGIESLTLRRIARRAGVSHGAPLRHFSSLADLLAEVAASGFRLLSRAIDDGANSLPVGSNPIDRLRAASRAYVRTAVENPGLFTLMFSPHRLDVSNARFSEDSSGAFERLVRLVEAGQRVGWNADQDTRLLAGVVWSSVHGLASLWSLGALNGPLPDITLDDALSLSNAMLLGDARPNAPHTPPHPGAQNDTRETPA